MFTVNDMIKELRKPGKIEMPIIMQHDAVHIVVDKSDLINHLKRLNSNDKSPWSFVTMNGDIRRFDIND